MWVSDCSWYVGIRIGVTVLIVRDSVLVGVFIGYCAFLLLVGYSSQWACQDLTSTLV